MENDSDDYRSELEAEVHKAYHTLEQAKEKKKLANEICRGCQKALDTAIKMFLASNKKYALLDWRKIDDDPDDEESEEDDSVNMAEYQKAIHKKSKRRSS